MSRANPNYPDTPVLVLAPSGNDARNAGHVLQQAGICPKICATMPDLCAQAGPTTGALLISEEILDAPALRTLLDFIIRQPHWSDVPIILLTASGEASQRIYNILHFFDGRANVTLVEKPLRALTLVGVVRSALRSRNHQYEVRNLLQELRHTAAELDERVKHRTARLEETLSEMEAFSYSVSHDLRAPLRAMQGYSRHLLNHHSEKLDDEGRDFLGRINKSAERLDRLTQDVLTYSRVVRNPVTLATISLARLIPDILQQYPNLQPDRVDITLVPPLLEVIGQEASLIQCVSNLINNAIKFVAPGQKPAVKISTEFLPESHTVKLWFEDNGIGIEPEQLKRIFGIFERVSKEYEGTGIGLAIVRKAAERMGGAVGVESTFGVGSKFWLQLPASKL